MLVLLGRHTHCFVLLRKLRSEKQAAHGLEQGCMHAGCAHSAGAVDAGVYQCRSPLFTPPAGGGWSKAHWQGSWALPFGSRAAPGKQARCSCLVGVWYVGALAPLSWVASGLGRHEGAVELKHSGSTHAGT